MTWPAPPGAYGAADPLFLLLIALAVEAYLGGHPLRPSWLPNPRRAVARIVGQLAHRLDRPRRGARALRLRGVCAIVAVALSALLAGALIGWLTRHYPFAWIVELLLLGLLIDQRATWRQGEAVRAGLRARSLIRAREALRPLAIERVAPATIDGFAVPAIVITALDGLARRFVDRLAAPVFWYVVAGLPGLFAQQAVYVAAATLGHGSAPFGAPARAANRALALLPGLLAGFLLAMAAIFVPQGRPLAALGALAKGAGAPGVLAAAIGARLPLGRMTRGLGVFAVGCLIDAGLVALLALGRLSL